MEEVLVNESTVAVRDAMSAAEDVRDSSRVAIRAFAWASDVRSDRMWPLSSEMVVSVEEDVLSSSDRIWSASSRILTCHGTR